MSYPQPPPLRRPGSHALTDLDVVANIQLANARLTASAAARSRSRDEAPTASVLSPNPRFPQRQSSSTERRSASPPASTTTAAPSSRRASSSQPGERAQPTLSPASATVGLSPPSSSYAHPATEYVDMSPPDTKLTAAAAPAASSTTRRDTEAAELVRVRQQLEELQRLYSYEKRAHLQQRTRQLREEATQRHTEEGIVAQTTQLLTDYEELIKFRDVANAEHLEAVMQRISHEWQRCAAELEDTRDACATSLLQRLQTACATQQAALKAALQQHLVTIAQSTVDAEAQQFEAVATAVQDQVESFKTEYRAILEQDMEERRRLMDTQAAHREQQWLQFLKEEHARMIATGEVAAREASQRQLETLHTALRDITDLRENLVKEHAQRQGEVGRAYVDAYEGLADEYAAAAQETVAYVHRLQQEYADIIQHLHREVRRVAAEKHAAEQQAQQVTTHVQEAIAEQRHVSETTTYALWAKKFEEEHGTHRATLAQLSLTHDAALRELHAAHHSREAARTAQYEAELTRLRGQLTQQRDERSASEDAAVDKLTSVVRRLEEEKVVLQQSMLQLKEEQRVTQVSHEAEVQRVRKEQEQHFATQLQELDAHYEAALQQYKDRQNITAAEQDDGDDDNATGGASGSGRGGRATRTAVVTTNVLRRVTELEAELRDVQRAHATALQRTVDDTAALWSTRLKAMQAQQKEECDALETQHRRLRQSLLEEVQTRENAVEARCAELRKIHQQELQDAVLAEKVAAQRALERLRCEHEEDAVRVAADAVTRVQLREKALEAREQQLKETVAAWQRQRADEQTQLLQTLLQRVSDEAARQEGFLQEREMLLREAQDAFAQQQLENTHAARVSVHEEEKEKYDAILRCEQQRWVQFTIAEAQQRYTAWQASREAELTSVQAFHRQELNLLRASYEAQLQQLRDDQAQHVEKYKEEVQAREAAWTATRTASLDAYEQACAERLQEVLAREKATWEAAQQQRTSAAAAALDTVAQRAAEVLAVTEEERCRMESELRDTYVAFIRDQEEKTARCLTELHARHAQELATLRRENETRLQQQAEQLEEASAARSRESDAYLQQVQTAHAEMVVALRAEHASRLAEQRAATQEALLHAHQEANEAQSAHDALMEAAQRAAEQTHARQLEDLQKRCDAQAARLLRSETDARTEVQRMRATVEAELRQAYEQSMSELREALETRNQAYATLQASVNEQVHAEATRVQAKMEAAYIAFTAEQQREAATRVDALEAKLSVQQRRLQEQLACLSQQQEAALAAQAQSLRAEHDDACTELKAVYEVQQEEWKHLLEAAQAGRATAEDAVRTLTTQLAQQQVTQAQQQAVAVRALDATYRRVLEQAAAQLQEKREEVARQSLEEAEQHFVAAMLQRRPPSTNNNESSLSMQFLPTEAPEPFLAPSVEVAPSPRHASGSVKAVPRHVCNTVTTPVASRTPRSFPSPLPLSPASPVELVEVPERPVAASPSPAAPQQPQRLMMDQQRLRQLWDVLEVPREERHAFLDHIEALHDTPTEQQRLWATEQRRLEAQLPLLEALTRRDYVARQLRALPKAPLPLSAKSVNATAGGNPPPHAEKEEREDGKLKRSASTPESAAVQDRLADELEQLTAQLRRDVTAHETQYGQLFCYDGRRVMERLRT